MRSIIFLSFSQPVLHPYPSRSLPFLLISMVSRSARCSLVALLIRQFGETITAFTDKYFNILSIIFTILLIGGFLVLKALI